MDVSESAQTRSKTKASSSIFTEIAMVLRRTMSPIRSSPLAKQKSNQPENVPDPPMPSVVEPPDPPDPPDKFNLTDISSSHQSFDETRLMHRPVLTQRRRSRTLATSQLTKLQKLRAMGSAFCEEEPEFLEESRFASRLNSTLESETLIIEDEDELLPSSHQTNAVRESSNFSTLSPSKSCCFLTNTRGLKGGNAVKEGIELTKEEKERLSRTRSGGSAYHKGGEPDIHPELTVDKLMLYKAKENARNLNTLSGNLSSNTSKDVLEINTMFDFEPTSESIKRPKHRQRRKSTMGDLTMTFVGDHGSKRGPRRSSIATLARSIRNEQKTQQKFLDSRLLQAREGKDVANEFGRDGEATSASPKLQMPQSRSAVHYLAISPPRIRITDESSTSKNAEKRPSLLNEPTSLATSSPELFSSNVVSTEASKSRSSTRTEDIDDSRWDMGSHSNSRCGEDSDKEDLSDSPAKKPSPRSHKPVSALRQNTTEEEVIKVCSNVEIGGRRRRSSNISTTFHIRRQGSTSSSGSSIINFSSSSSSSTTFSRGNSESSRRSSTDTWGTSSTSERKSNGPESVGFNSARSR